MAKKDGESIEETAARLGLGATAPPKVSYTAPASHTAVRRSRGPVLGIAIAIVSIVVLVIVAGIAIGGAVSNGGGGNPFTAGSWSTYPGTAYDDPREILAAPSKEDVIAESERFIAEFRGLIEEEYDVVWIQDWEGDLSVQGNGYDGDSMLYRYSSPNWIGAAVSSDRGAREHIIELFTALTEKYGAEDFYLANDLYTDDGDAEWANSQFGSTDRGKQALWSASASNYSLAGIDMNLDVYDSSVPTHKDFDGAYWAQVVEMDGKTATLFINLRLSAGDLLPVDDRDEFTERIRQFDEDNKP